MKRTIVSVGLALAIATPAVAARCPYGEILRVSMGRCVGVHSRLAYGYVRAPRRRRIVVALPAKLLSTTRWPNGARTEPEIEVLRERLAHPAASLTPTEILLSRAAALAP
jgi:hypothetical protein